MKIKPTAGPGKPAGGLWPDNDECVVTAQEAITKGNLVSFDLLNADTDVSNNILGDPASGLANVIQSNAEKLEVVFAIALEDIADKGQGRVLVSGIAEGVTTGSTTEGTTLNGGAAGAMAPAIAAETVYGYQLDGVDPGRVLFDGINGFGVGAT